MTDRELLKITMERHELTIKAAAAAWSVSKNTLASALSGRCKVPATIWVAILEYEARVYERRQDITARAAAYTTMQRQYDDNMTPAKNQHLQKFPK
ncbi:MAG: hypothetical protein PHV59_03230 [Victivallales bacterium]|nr:hypothetical protein [Victivallales bacterium]